MVKFVFASIFSAFLPLATCGAQVSNHKPEPAIQFEETIRPLLVQYCNDCHAPGDMKDLDFLAAKTETDVAGLRDLYASIVEQLENRTMPPKDSAQPTDTDRKLMADWIKTALDLKPADFDRISPYVVEAYEDHEKNLWFGTMSDGAARYDGKSLRYFSTKDGLSGDTVVSIVEDHDRNLWFGTHTGASKYDGKNFTNFGIAEGLPGWGCNLLVDRNGNIWAGTNDGVFRFNGSSFSEFIIPDPAIKVLSFKVKAGKVWNLVEDKGGNIWFARDGYGACKFDGTAFTHFTKEDGLCSNNVSSIVEDRQGNIWFGCLSSDKPEYVNEGGLSRYDGTTFTQFPQVKGLGTNDIYTIYATKAGEIWIGATGVGAYRYDGETFSLFDETDRKFWTRYFGVQAILEDRNGSLWFGFSGGLFRFDGKSFLNVQRDGPWPGSATRPQEDEQLLDAPSDWKVEQIRFPLSFAPSIEFNGFEDIRFAPGWSRPDSPEFWTYKFVWQVGADPQLTTERLGVLAETYFDGLSRAVALGGEQDTDPMQKPVAVFVEAGTNAGKDLNERKNFTGRLRIYDAFSTKKWIYLNAKVKSMKSGEKDLIIFELSPQHFEHEVWTQLEKVRLRIQDNVDPVSGK